MFIDLGFETVGKEELNDVFVRPIDGKGHIKLAIDAEKSLKTNMEML